MQFQSISGWHEHIQAGYAYLETACNGLSRPAVFNNALIFQLAAMAIEKLIVGVCQYYRQMPTDHTLSGLVAALEPVCPLQAELAARIRQIEQKENLCALTPVFSRSADDGEIQSILAVGREVEGFARRHLPWEDSATAGA